MSTRVLVVEDELNIAEAVRFVLEREGFEVTCVANGQEGLRMLRANPPDLLVLDVMLPGLNGFEMLKALRADNALRALPVAVLTAKTQAADRQRALDLGAQVCIAKPFSNADLVDQLRRLVPPS